MYNYNMFIPFIVIIFNLFVSMIIFLHYFSVVFISAYMLYHHDIIIFNFRHIQHRNVA